MQRINIIPGTVTVIVSCVFTKNISLDDLEDIFYKTLFIKCNATEETFFASKDITLTTYGNVQLEEAIQQVEHEESCKLIRKEMVIQKESFQKL